ncbi:MAG: transglutaminase domain-containing protein, partial [Bacteroidota bacterium]
FPDLQEGSIIEYEYKSASPYLSRLPTWYFQGDIPVRHSELRVIMPEVFSYAQMVQGHEQLASSDKNRKPLSTRLGVIDAEYSTYIAKDVPALREEPHITTMYDYMMRIKFQLQSINIPGSYYKTFMTNWDAVATELLEWEIFGGQYLKSRLSKDLIVSSASTMSKAENDKEKLAAAYTYLASNIAWDGTYDYTCDQNINKSFDDKKANSAELSFMLIALLREHGVQAFPVLTSTRSYGKMFPVYPFRDQFNHVLVCVIIDDKLTLVDTPQKHRPLDLLNIQSLNRQGLVISDAQTAQWIDIKPSNQRNVMMANLKFEEEKLVGDIQCNLKGYEAVRERRKAQSDEKGEFWVSRFEDHAVEASISDVEYENLSEIYKPFRVEDRCDINKIIHHLCQIR